MFRNKVDRSKDFKKGIDGDDCRRKREDESFSVRKVKREEELGKRRKIAQGNGNNGGNLEMKLEGGILSQDFSLIDKIKNPTSSPQVQLQAMAMLRKNLSLVNKPPIQDVIDSGVVPRVIELMSNRNSSTQLVHESAWVLTNIASGTASQTEYVAKCGAIPKLVYLLQHPDKRIRDQCVWALGNIAGDCPELRDSVISANALPMAMLLCKSANSTSTDVEEREAYRNIVWLISNMCKGEPRPDFRRVAECLPLLSQLLEYSKDPVVLTDTCWALCHLSDDKKDEEGMGRISQVIQSGCVPRLIHLLDSNQPECAGTHSPAIKTLGNIVSGNERETQAALDCGLIQVMAKLIKSNRKIIRKEVCWALSNVTAGTMEQVNAFLHSSSLVKDVIHAMESDAAEVQREAAWAISNVAAEGSASQVQQLVKDGVIPALSAMLDSNDIKAIQVTLEGLEGILRIDDVKYPEMLEECGGLTKLEDLQKHENGNIYKHAVRLLTTYFECSSNEAADVMNNTCQFGFGSADSSVDGDGGDHHNSDNIGMSRHYDSFGPGLQFSFA